MSRRANKQRRVASLVGRKPPGKCMYDSKTIKNESLEAATSKDSSTKKNNQL
jgi:hypothetical protein